MADYITSTSTSIQSSPSRKRTRETHTNRSTCKTPVTISSNVEGMESSNSETSDTLSSFTQPRSSIHSVQIGISSLNSNSISSNGFVNSSNTTTTTQAPISVSIFFFTILFTSFDRSTISF